MNHAFGEGIGPGQYYICPCMVRVRDVEVGILWYAYRTYLQYTELKAVINSNPAWLKVILKQRPFN